MTLERVDCWCDILNSRNVCNGDVDAELACLIMSIAYFKRNCGVVSIGDEPSSWLNFVGPGSPSTVSQDP